jgi:5-methyltetrahydrofolate--homocysteine methyltransferase
MDIIRSLLSENKYILTEGAMGTMLFAAGLTQGYSPEFWNVEQPEKVAAVHQAYLGAGAQILLTNTFGGNRFRLALHNAQDRVAELNRAAVELLQKVTQAAGRPILVAGDIGPTGQVLKPYGEMSFEEARAAFAEQAAALIRPGVHLIWIETMADLEEVRAAVEGVRQVSQEISIMTTMTFDTRGRTMMGVTPEKAVTTMVSFGATAVGGNCGNGPDEILGVIEKMHATLPEAILVAKANAGVPTLVGGRPVYGATPADMAEYAVKVFHAGARIIGACCGSTPDHIKAIAQALALQAGS